MYTHTKKETIIYKKKRSKVKQEHKTQTKQRWRTKQLTDLVCDSEFLSVVGA